MQCLSRTLNPGVRVLELWAWAMLDFASSGYTTVVITAVFSAYFVGVVAGGAPWATLAWTATLSVSYLLVMFSLPILAAYADFYAGKRRLLFVSVSGCVLGTLALALSGPGDLWIAIIAIVFSNFCFGLGESAIASFLPELAKPQAFGRVSGWAWGFGYVGGLFALAVALLIVTMGQTHGLDTTSTVPWVMLSTGAMFFLASMPAWFLLKERAVKAPRLSQRIQNKVVLLSALSPLIHTFKELGLLFPEFRRLLFCIVFYQAGIAVVITLAAVYAEQVMGFQMEQTIGLIVAVNVAAAFGALFFGRLQDRLGHRSALAIALTGWLITALTAYFAVTEIVFWFAAGLAGLCMGTTQSAGRAMVAALAPADRLSRFFALWSVATQLAAAIGPLTYGLVTWITGGNQRLAMLSTTVFFILALMTLKSISWQRGALQRQAST